MQEEDFAKRLSALRQEKGASARDMICYPHIGQ